MDRNLARAVTDKKPVPEIDFTLHTMEDGTQVSTMDRVVKGEASRFLLPPHRNPIANRGEWKIRGPSAGPEHPFR